MHSQKNCKPSLRKQEDRPSLISIERNKDDSLGLICGIPDVDLALFQDVSCVDLSVARGRHALPAHTRGNKCGKQSTHKGQISSVCKREIVLQKTDG
jgi:hypothetical protein